MEVDIVNANPPNQVVKLQVACRTEDKELANELQKLFNETLGHCLLPEKDETSETWSVNVFCQLHLRGDKGVHNNNADQGSTVAHAFTRVLNIANLKYPNATISEQVKECISVENAANWTKTVDLGEGYKINQLEENPQLCGLPKLAEILQNTVLNVPTLLEALRNAEDELRPTEEIRDLLLNGAFVELSTALDEDTKEIGVENGEKKDASPPKSGSYLPHILGGVGVIALFAIAIYLRGANHLSGVNNPVKVGG